MACLMKTYAFLIFVILAIISINQDGAKATDEVTSKPNAKVEACVDKVMKDYKHCEGRLASIRCYEDLRKDVMDAKIVEGVSYKEEKRRFDESCPHLKHERNCEKESVWNCVFGDEAIIMKARGYTGLTKNLCQRFDPILRCYDECTASQIQQLGLEDGKGRELKQAYSLADMLCKVDYTISSTEAWGNECKKEIFEKYNVCEGWKAYLACFNGSTEEEKTKYHVTINEQIYNDICL